MQETAEYVDYLLPAYDVKYASPVLFQVREVHVAPYWDALDINTPFLYLQDQSIGMFCPLP